MSLQERDDELLNYVDSRLMKYPDVVSNTDKFESEETTDWDKAFVLAEQLLERGYPVPDVDRWTLATHILNSWKKNESKEEKNLGGFDQ